MEASVLNVVGSNLEKKARKCNFLKRSSTLIQQIGFNVTVWRNCQFQCCQLTESKSHNFSVTQILREINFEDSLSAKSAILTHLEAINFCTL